MEPMNTVGNILSLKPLPSREAMPCNVDQPDRDRGAFAGYSGDYIIAYGEQEGKGIKITQEEDESPGSEECRRDRNGDNYDAMEDEKCEEERIALLVESERKSWKLKDSESECEKDDEENGFTVDTAKDSFRSHLEHCLTDEQVTRILHKRAKFVAQMDFAGSEEVKWLATAGEFPKVEKKLSAYEVKLRLRNRWKTLHGDSTWGDFQSQQQCQFFSFCNSYQDILYTNRSSFYKGEEEKDACTTNAYLLHVLNHIFKTRDLVAKNNERLSHQTTNGARADGYEAPRDQGFTRPKVLILLPLRSIVLRVVRKLLDLIPPQQKVSVGNLDRFLDEYGTEGDGNEDVDQNLILGNSVASSKKEKKVTAKPDDFQALFSGNNDDHFRFGIKFTRKSVKFYSDFYSSDIVIASPLGLITRIGEAESEKEKDIDFLSSIEIFVIDYAEIILMQNWSHIDSVVKEVNNIPRQQHGADFMRIREWLLNGQGMYYRQSIVLSAFADAGINALFHRTFVNFAGKLKSQSKYSGVLSKVLFQVQQVYEQVKSDALAEVDDARFEFFTKQIFPKLKNSGQSGNMIFIRSYFDFVRLRNFLKSQNASFCLLGEYTKTSDISRARAWFFHGKRHFLLYTERAHFYHRYKIRGMKTIIFYSLPDHEDFYAEMLNMLKGSENPSCITLFSRFDKLQLERVVGTSYVHKLLSSDSRLFMFY